jgi:hypothetical protein
MKNNKNYFIQPLLPLLMVLLYLSCEKDMTSIKPGSNGEEKLLLTGQVVEKQGGSPVAGAVVKVLKNQVSDTTDSKGSIRLEGLSPGADTIVVAVPAYLCCRSRLPDSSGDSANRGKQPTAHLVFNECAYPRDPAESNRTFGHYGRADRAGHLYGHRFQRIVFI